MHLRRIILPAVLAAMAAGLTLYLAGSPVATAPTSRVEKPVQADPPQAVKSGSAVASEDFRAMQSELLELKEAIGILVENQTMAQQSIDQLESGAQVAITAEEEEFRATAHEEADISQQFARLESRLTRQETDTVWASETLGQIEASLLHQDLEGIQVMDSACGSTLCRVDMQLPSDQAREDTLRKLSIHRAWEGATVFEMTADGSVRFYIAREGHDLPSA